MKRAVAASVITATALSAAVVPVAASSASAATVQSTSCGGKSQGSWGVATMTFGGKTKISHLDMYVDDESADGHHVGIRLVTTAPGGARHYWLWHQIYGGINDHRDWHTSATLAKGIKTAYVQVATKEGTKVVAYCNSAPVAHNPAY